MSVYKAPVRVLFGGSISKIIIVLLAAQLFSIIISRLTLLQIMSSDNETQQVVLALIDESENPASKKIDQKLKTRRPRKNYCTEDYLVKYGVPAVIIILVIVGIILAFIVIRKYNQNCTSTKGASCRGMTWFFT